MAEKSQSIQSIHGVQQTRWTKKEWPPDWPNPDFPELKYRRIVHQKRQSRNQFLNSIPDRVQVKPILFVRLLIDLQSQEYGTKYWTAVSDVGLVMESIANYLRYFEKQDRDQKLNWLAGMYQALAILLDQQSGHQPRISSLLLMQTVTRRQWRLRATNHQSDFHRSTIEILDPSHALPVAKPYYLGVHQSFGPSENRQKFLLFWNIF